MCFFTPENIQTPHHWCHFCKFYWGYSSIHPIGGTIGWTTATSNATQRCGKDLDLRSEKTCAFRFLAQTAFKFLQVQERLRCINTSNNKQLLHSLDSTSLAPLRPSPRTISCTFLSGMFFRLKFGHPKRHLDICGCIQKSGRENQSVVRDWLLVISHDLLYGFITTRRWFLVLATPDFSHHRREDIQMGATVGDSELDVEKRNIDLPCVPSVMWWPLPPGFLLRLTVRLCSYGLMILSIF